MPRLRISKGAADSVKAFKPFVETALGEEIDDQSYLDIIIHEGITRMTLALMHPQQQESVRIEVGAAMTPPGAWKRWGYFIRQSGQV